MEDKKQMNPALEEELEDFQETQLEDFETNLEFPSDPVPIDPKVVTNDLIERGRKYGKIQAQEIAVVLDELDFSPEQLMQLYEKL